MNNEHRQQITEILAALETFALTENRHFHIMLQRWQITQNPLTLITALKLCYLLDVQLDRSGGHNIRSQEVSAKKHLSSGLEIRLVGLRVRVSSRRDKLNKQHQQSCLVPTAESRQG